MNAVGMAKSKLSMTSYGLSLLSCGTPNPADWMGVAHLLGVPLIVRERTDHMSMTGYDNLQTLYVCVQ